MLYPLPYPGARKQRCGLFLRPSNYRTIRLYVLKPGLAKEIQQYLVSAFRLWNARGVIPHAVLRVIQTEALPGQRSKGASFELGWQFPLTGLTCRRYKQKEPLPNAPQRYPLGNRRSSDRSLLV